MINGGGGSDTLNGGAGNDTLNGGTGTDTMVGRQAATTSTLSTMAATWSTRAPAAGIDLVFADVDYTLRPTSSGWDVNGFTTTYAINLTGNAVRQRDLRQ